MYFDDCIFTIKSENTNLVTRSFSSDGSSSISPNLSHTGVVVTWYLLIPVFVASTQSLYLYKRIVFPTLDSSLWSDYTLLFTLQLPVTLYVAPWPLSGSRLTRIPSIIFSPTTESTHSSLHYSPSCKTSRLFLSSDRTLAFPWLLGPLRPLRWKFRCLCKTSSSLTPC